MNHINNDDVSTWALPENAIGRLGRGRVRSIAFSSGGDHFAVATQIGVWLYDLTTLQPAALWDTERGMVSAVSLSTDGQWIATGNDDGIVKVRQTETQQCVAKIQGWHRGISHLAFSPDNQYVAASGAGYGGVYVWCTKTGQHALSFTVAEPKKPARGVRSPICFSPDGMMLAYFSHFSISVKHLKTKEHITTINTSRRIVNNLAFSPCGEYLILSIERKFSSDQSPEVQIWHLQKETLEMVYSGHDAMSVITASSADGNLRVASVDKDRVRIWDADREEELDSFEYQGLIGNVRFAFSGDGKYFAIATPRKCHVWFEGPPPRSKSFSGHLFPADSMFFFQKTSNTLVSRHWNQSGIAFWDVEKRHAIRTLPVTRDTGKALALSPCEDMLAVNVGESGKNIEVLSVVSGTPITILTEHQHLVTALAFSPTGKDLISGDVEGNLCMWDVETWKKQHKLSECGRITKVTFHPDGTKVAIATRDSIALVWDFTIDKQMRELSLELLLERALYKGGTREIRRRVRKNPSPSWRASIHPITFSPCGDFIAGGLSGEIRLWDATTYEIHMAILLPQGCRRPFALAFSPCGRYLASGSWWQWTDKVSTRLWNIATGENIATFWGHSTDVQDLAFSPDGTVLASGSYDGTILLWDIKPYL